MPPAKVNKINTSGSYPCPCRRQGRLSPIVLTDALGCEQCHHVFVVKPDGYTIEQCSSHHPSKTWHWTGRYWQPSRDRKQTLYLRLLLSSLCLGFVVLVFFPSILPFSLSMDVQIGIALVVALLILILWSSLYRR